MITGTPIVFGIPKEIKPLAGAPEGKRRFRFRNKCAGRVFIKTATGIHHFVLTIEGEMWGLLPQGINHRE